jgi:hypothetical protein
MRRAARQNPVLRRCPLCHCAQKLPPDGICVACGWSAEPRHWEEETAKHPVQPEERDGHRCPECGEPVTVQMPLSPPVQSPLHLWTTVGVTVAGMAILADGPWVIPFWIMSPVALVLPLHILYRRYRGAASIRTVVVLCRNCGFVRVGGRTNPDVTGPFRRGARVFDGIYRKVLPVGGFFLVLIVGALVMETPPEVIHLVPFAVAGILLHAVRWYRGVFGLRSWW